MKIEPFYEIQDWIIMKLCDLLRGRVAWKFWFNCSFVNNYGLNNYKTYWTSWGIRWNLFWIERNFNISRKSNKNALIFAKLWEDFKGFFYGHWHSLFAAKIVSIVLHNKKLSAWDYNHIIVINISGLKFSEYWKK